MNGRDVRCQLHSEANIATDTGRFKEIVDEIYKNR